MTDDAVELTVADREIVVEGSGLGSPRARLFFESVLFAHEDRPGRWRCPLRERPPEVLVQRIAEWLEQQGRRARAAEDHASRLLERRLQRTVMFQRSGAAARAFLGLGPPPTERGVVTRSDVRSRLQNVGWNFAARDLRPHQLDNAAHALNATNAANFSVPGAGKTATALAVLACQLEAGTVSRAVVVGPLSCFRPWESEAADVLGGALVVHRLHGQTPAERACAYRRSRQADVFLLSFAAAASDVAPLRRLGEAHDVMLVVDESHRVKRFAAGQWSQAMMDIADRARVKLILSGTPMPQSPHDLWSQFTVLWPGGELVGTRGAYRARAAASFPDVVRDLRPFFSRTAKRDLGLREPRVLPEPVELAPVQREIYDLIADRLRARLPDAALWADTIQALRRAHTIRLLQAASNPDLLNAEDGFYGVGPVRDETLMQRLAHYRHLGELPAKFDWALRRLDALKAHQEKTVVWTSFIRNIDQFRRLASERLDAPIFHVDGRIPAAGGESPEDELDDTRERRIDGFLDTDGFAVLVANPAACAESISLHRGCRRAIYLDRTYDCARWMQSVDRIHRLGLPPDAVVEIDVPQVTADGNGTVDRLVQLSLARKENRMQQLLQGAELRGAELDQQDTLAGAEGDDEDLDALLRYLMGEPD